MYVRLYLDELLEADLERAVIVTGDFNDGPGSDYFERHYLTHNLAAMLAGNPFDPPKMFRHGFIDRELRERNFTAIFDDFIDEIDDRKILLDHILCSPGIHWDLTEGRVEHDVFDPEIDHTADEKSRQHLPSDHRPQSVTF
jgi:endonuclease/exonuclease/phosphatase family metal-dependent hydrolase